MPYCKSLLNFSTKGLQGYIFIEDWKGKKTWFCVNLFYMNKTKLFISRKEKYSSSKGASLHFVSMIEGFVAGHFLQNVHIAKLTTLDASLESELLSMVTSEGPGSFSCPFCKAATETRQ